MTTRNRVILYLILTACAIAGLVYLIGPINSAILTTQAVIFFVIRYWIQQLNVKMKLIHENLTDNQKKLYKKVSRIEELNERR